MAEPWTCSSCYDTPEKGKLLVAEDNVCTLCFRRLFALAVESEENYPPRWGKFDVTFEQNSQLLDPQLRAAYPAKVLEYACPLKERVYCQRTDPPRRPDACGTFVGQALKRKECVKCAKCAWYTCLRCRDTFSIADIGATRIDLEHDCEPFRFLSNEAEAFAGLIPGKDYQTCPNPDCGRKVELLDGCNKISCACKTNFCFICGKTVQPDDWHWRPGSGCPRWGQPRSGREIYDRFGADAAQEALEREMAALQTPAMGNGMDQNGVLEQRWRQQRGDEARALQVQMQFVREAQDALVRGERERLRLRAAGQGGELGNPALWEGQQGDGQVGAPHRRRRRRRHGGTQVDGPMRERHTDEGEENQAPPRPKAKGLRETLFGSTRKEK